MKRSNQTIFVVVQLGGSSQEWYTEFHETLEAAEARIREIQDHTYDAIGPFKAPASMAAGGTAAESVIDDICSTIAGIFMRMHCATIHSLLERANLSIADFGGKDSRSE